MNFNKLMTLIKDNQSLLPLTLRYTKESNYLISSKEHKTFYNSLDHQTDKHLFRRISFKSFI